MGIYLRLDDLNSVIEKVDEKADNLFKAKPGIPQLEVSKYGKQKIEDGKERIWGWNQTVKDIAEIKELRRVPDSTVEIFFVRQDRSWTTLNISRELFQGLLDEYAIFSHFWRCMFTFGRKYHENEFDFPEFRARRTLHDCASEIHGAFRYNISDAIPENIDGLLESAYMLRRVELHGRELAEGQSPWSIRQTGVYHRLNVNFSSDGKFQCSTSTFVMIAPSQNAENQLQECFKARSPVVEATFPWNVHRLLVADSMKNWMDYMAHLEEKLKGQSNPILLANVGSGKENLAPLLNFHLNFGDRQELKDLEDQILNLQVILSTILRTITRIRDHCRKSCQGITMSNSEMRELDIVVDEFDEYIREAEACLERAKLLQGKADSTTKLLSDLLNYEEAVALKDLTRETQLESRSMHHLTERSTKDAAAVKILTVITLVYLPTTIVANFFSTQFVQTNDAGDMRLSSNAWLLAAIAIPLTIITIAFWGMWVYFTKVTPPSDGRLPDRIPAILRRQQSSFKSILSSRKRKQSSPVIPAGRDFRSIFTMKSRHPSTDIEAGLVDPKKEISTPPPPSFAATWSSTATTVKFM